VRGGGVDRLALTGGGAVAEAVVGGAEVRAALDDAARYARAGLAAVLRRGHPGVLRPAAAAGGRRGGVEVAGPLPDVAGHVVEPEAVGRVAPDRGRALLARRLQVLPGEFALPGVGHRLAPRGRVVAPGERRAVEAAAGGELPFGLGWELLARPRGVGVGVLGRDVGDRVLVEAVQGAARAARVAPVRARGVAPPLGHVAQAHRAPGRVEHQRAGVQQGRVGVRVLGRVERALGHRDVAGRLREAAELGHRDRAGVDPEGVDLDPADRALLRVEAGRPHAEAAAGHEHHAFHPAAVADWSCGHRLTRASA
jgi:hypothetical protein